MAELLLELFSEEIPASMQEQAAVSLKEAVCKKLEELGVVFKKSESYVTPRRLTLVIEGLSEVQEDSVTERKGPKVDAPEGAISGFLKSTGLNLEDLEKRKSDKGEFYFAVIKTKGKPVSQILTEVLEDVICSFSWPKSMRWGNYNIRWIRPLHNILCIFNGSVLPVEFGHLKSNDKTYGHRFLNPEEIRVKGFDDYKEKLKNAHVILCRQERKDIILKEAEHQAKTCSVNLKHDKGLLEELAGLVEWPVIVLGKIEERFMDVPQEVLITSMRSHQKYFSMLDNSGKLAPFFIAVSNMPKSDQNNMVIGYESVLRARLSDAKFFWEKDRRTGLGGRIDDLKKVVFHAKLGSVYDKTERVTELAKFLSVWVPHANLVLVEKAAKLAKADLTTDMVGEFPELQGLMGGYYALEGGEEKAVADAIKEHYSPVGKSDNVPTSPVSIAVALADKIDTLIGLFSVGEKPTGSRDPFALRRAALGIIRIILENKLRVPIRLLLEKTIAKYPKAVFKPEEEKRTKKILAGRKVKQKKYDTIDEVLEFFADRLKVLLKDNNIRHDLIEAVFDGGREDDIYRLVARVYALDEFVQTEDGKNLVASYKRAANIVEAEEEKDNVEYLGKVSVDLLVDRDEKNLYEEFTKVSSKVEKMIKSDDFKGAMQELSTLRTFIDKFFDEVTVNAKESDVRRNRLTLLGNFRDFLSDIADFGRVEL